MIVSQASLTLFLIILSWHLGLSMELPVVAWMGSGLGVLAAGRLVTVERPTWGLTFVLFATGALAGSQVLEDWALPDSWPRENGLGAGIMISLLLYSLWIFAARGNSGSDRAIDRDCQTILVWGLLSLLLIAPAESTVIDLFGEAAPVLTLVGMLLACIPLLAGRLDGMLASRLLLLLPLAAIVPLMLIVLNLGQGPVVAALGNLFPRSGDFTSTGFSPFQTMRASVFLRPSNRPVMRIETEAPPTHYLAGNRLVTLSEELVWLPQARSVRSYGAADAEALPGNQWRYAIDNHHVSGGHGPGAGMAARGLGSDSYVFIAPGATHITGPFTAISRNAADVWTPGFERGAEQRWQLAFGNQVTADTRNEETLALPGFWDEALQRHSESLAGPGGDRRETADNIVNYFLGREYTLQTDFDPRRPFHDFFLNERAGYCFWFASATTLALRANGIPSRLVGGYMMHEQLDENLWLVRERDAHSWVEWQDAEGYWHTVDPTPASITAFFGGYQSSALSVWYHRLAARWQALLDRLLANELAASVIRYGGLALLLFLFAREYRRISSRQRRIDEVARQWRKLWERFLKNTGLPEQPSWTATAYRQNLPADWTEERRNQVRRFLEKYQSLRFARTDRRALQQASEALEELKVN